jgi:hypothetical protein
MSTRSKRMTSSSSNMTPGRPNLTTETVPFDFIQSLFAQQLVSKLKVEADTDDVLVKFDGTIRIDCRDGACRGDCLEGRGIIAATISVIAGYIPHQIDKEILDFERPILGERELNPGTGCPAPFSIILVWQAAQRSLHIRASTACSPLEENAVPCVAEARTERSQPIACSLAAQSSRGRIDGDRTSRC